MRREECTSAGSRGIGWQLPSRSLATIKMTFHDSELVVYSSSGTAAGHGPLDLERQVRVPAADVG